VFILWAHVCCVSDYVPVVCEQGVKTMNKEKKVRLLCRILGHNYDIFESDGIVYRNCRRCSGCHEILKEAGNARSNTESE
jgi:CRISPR/Cas system-associated protein Cas10 (large subunit of type III CRISPR-Cas system)